MITLATYDYLWLLLAYLLGSVSSAIIVCRLAGLPDPRTQGSGNPGATNVLRIGGKKMAVITLIGDTLKGVVTVLAAKLAGLDLDMQILIGLAAFTGHLFPVFFGFRGGKGVATALGVLIVSAWPVGLSTLGTWLFVAKIMKISSLSALLAFLFTPLYAWYWMPDERFYLYVVSAMSVILLMRHHSNIRKLIAGTED